MSDSIKAGDISNSQAVAIGDGATAIVNLPQPRPKSVSNLPPFNPNFTGRQEHLTAIADTFTSTDGAIVVTQAISGMGGVGKTQVALAYAHTHRDKYDIIWLLHADDTATLDNSLQQLGQTLELDLAGKDAPTVRRIILSHLSSSKKAVLLLLDNADQIEPRDLRATLPNNCHLLITSRRDDSQWSSMARTLTLGTFTEAEAMDFWQRRLDSASEVELLAKAQLLDREALAAELGHLPLAMEQAAAFMLKRKKSAAAYLQQFKERRTALWAREKAPDNYHATVATTWQMAFDHAQTTTGAADLLNLCCCFAPDDILLSVMQEQADSLPQPLAAVMADEDMREDAVAALSDYSLVTVADGKLNMHRLVQAVVRQQMGAEPAQAWLQAALNLLAKAYHFDPYDMRTWAQCGQLLPHVTTTANLAAEWDVNNEQAAWLNNAAGHYLKQYGNYAAARPFLKRALAINEKQLGSDHPHTAGSLNNLGELLRVMGEYGEARPFYERALAIAEKQLGSDHPHTATCLNNLGLLLRAMGEYGEARPFYKRALAIREKQLGFDHPDTAQSLNNLGGLLYAMGEYGEARPFYERALAIAEKQLGPNHPHTATCLNNLGGLLYTMGEYGEARPFYKRALAIREKQLGADHPDTATSLNNLGILLYTMEKYGEARPFYERALAIREQQLGPDHPDTAQSLDNLGTLLRAMGEYGEARPYYKRALAIDEKGLGSDHPDTARDLNNLGELLRTMGEYGEARPFYVRALAIWEKQLGSGHRQTATGLNNLAWLSYDEGDVREAARLMRRALAIWEKALGDAHPSTQAARQSLAVIEAALA